MTIGTRVDWIVLDFIMILIRGDEKKVSFAHLTLIWNIQFLAPHYPSKLSEEREIRIKYEMVKVIQSALDSRRTRKKTQARRICPARVFFRSPTKKMKCYE